MVAVGLAGSFCEELEERLLREEGVADRERSSLMRVVVEVVSVFAVLSLSLRPAFIPRFVPVLTSRGRFGVARDVAQEPVRPIIGEDLGLKGVIGSRQGVVGVLEPSMNTGCRILEKERVEDTIGPVGDVSLVRLEGFNPRVEVLLVRHTIVLNLPLVVIGNVAEPITKLELLDECLVVGDPSGIGDLMRVQEPGSRFAIEPGSCEANHRFLILSIDLRIINEVEFEWGATGANVRRQMNRTRYG